MVFKNRKDAGRQLARELYHLGIDPHKSVVCGITRGGVPVAYEIAKKFVLPFFPLVIKKIGAPYQRELAIGAVGSSGKAFVDKVLMEQVGANKNYLDNEIKKMRQEANEREKFLGKKLSRNDARGKDLIIVDDGLATGATVIAAANKLKLLGASNLYLALPCGAIDSIKSVKKYFVKIICLEESTEFVAVGQFYSDFSPTTDEQVKKLLERAGVKTR